MKTKTPEPTVEELLREAREELARTQRILKATQNALVWWMRHALGTSPCCGKVK